MVSASISLIKGEVEHFSYTYWPFRISPGTLWVSFYSLLGSIIAVEKLVFILAATHLKVIISPHVPDFKDLLFERMNNDDFIEEVTIAG